MENKKIKKSRKPRKIKDKKKSSKNKNTQNIKINISSTGSGGGGTPSMPASTISKTSVVPLPIQAFTQAERTGENVEANNLLKRIENQQQSAINQLAGVMNQYVIPAIQDKPEPLPLPANRTKIGRPAGSKNKSKGEQSQLLPGGTLTNPPADTTNNTLFENIEAANQNISPESLGIVAIEGNNIPDQEDEALNVNVAQVAQVAPVEQVSPIVVNTGGGAVKGNVKKKGRPPKKNN